jgi:hypothetical protein
MESKRQVKRKVHFWDEDEIEKTQRTKQPQAKKRILVNPSPVENLDPELDSTKFMLNYYTSNLVKTQIIQNVSYICKMYESYLKQNHKNTEPMVNLVLYLNSVYTTINDINYHYNQMRNLINSSVGLGINDIDTVIQSVTNSQNEFSKYNIFGGISKLPIGNTEVIDVFAYNTNYIQKDLNCLSNIKIQLEINNLEFNPVNCHVVVNNLIRKQKLIQFVILDILLKSDTKFPNLIYKSNLINFMSLTKLRIQQTYNELGFELGLFG